MTDIKNTANARFDQANFNDKEKMASIKHLSDKGVIDTSVNDFGAARRQIIAMSGVDIPPFVAIAALLCAHDKCVLTELDQLLVKYNQWAELTGAKPVNVIPQNVAASLFCLYDVAYLNQVTQEFTLNVGAPKDWNVYKEKFFDGVPKDSLDKLYEFAKGLKTSSGLIL